MFSLLIIKHISSGNLHFRLLQHFPFAEYQMDMIIRFCLVMMKAALHSIPYLLWKVSVKSLTTSPACTEQNFGKCNNNSRPYDTFPADPLALNPTDFFLSRFSKLRCCPFCLIGLIEILLSFRIGDIINTPCHIGQLTLSDK